MARRFFVTCDCCGTPARHATNIPQARQAAQRQGFLHRSDGDRCWLCATPGHQPCQAKPATLAATT